MAIWWDDLEIVSTVDRLEGEGRAYQMTGEDLIQAGGRGQTLEDQDRLAFVRMLHLLRDETPRYLAFDQLYYMGPVSPNRTSTGTCKPSGTSS
jgi:hypothetical protein